MSADADKKTPEAQNAEEQTLAVPGAAETPAAPPPDGDPSLASPSDGAQTPDAPGSTGEADRENAGNAINEKAEEAPEDEDEDRPMTLHDHLQDLRKRLMFSFLFILAGFFVCYHFRLQLRTLLMAPLTAAMEHAAPGAGLTMQFTAPTEGLFSDMKVAFVVSAALTSPLIFYQIWAFVAPGLHKEEKHHLLPLAFCSALCFFAGAAFCYFLAFPVIFDFLMSFTSPTLRAQPSLEESLNFVLRLLMAFGCIFELPVISFFLARIGLVTAAWMRKVRRYAILASFIVAAVLSPPDVTSMLFMAGPLLILYEGSILVAAIFGKKRPEKTEDEDDEDDDDDDEYEDDEEDEEEDSSASTQQGRHA